MATAELPMELSNQPSSEDAPNTHLLPRIAAGDANAVHECLEKYSGLVWTLAKRYCRHISDAEDACQDIFVELWQKAERFDPSKASETTYIAMIARRRLIDRHRRGPRPETDAVDLEGVSVEAPESNDSVELAEEARKAADCMRKLSQNQQKIISMSIHLGKSHASISKVLSIPLGTVKSYARRGLLQLRECMNRSVLPADGRGQ